MSWWCAISLPFVIFGEPYGDSMRTFRPFGPRVVATALARVSTPARSAARPSTPNLSSYHKIRQPSYPIAFTLAHSPSQALMPRTLCANRSCCEVTERSLLVLAKAAVLEVNARCMIMVRKELRVKLQEYNKCHLWEKIEEDGKWK